MAKEIEKKWKVHTNDPKKLFKSLSRRKGAKVKKIEQIYLSFEPIEKRIRKITDVKTGKISYIYGEKRDREDSGNDDSLYIREEFEKEVSQELWDKNSSSDLYIQKTRVVLRTGEEFDFFERGVILEKEFSSKKEVKNYSPPSIKGVLKYTRFNKSNQDLVKTKVELQKRADKALGKGFKIIAQPMSYDENLLISAKCGHIFELNADHIRTGENKGCKICNNLATPQKTAMSDEEIAKVISQYGNKEYSFIKKQEGYKNSRDSKVYVEHSSCGNKFWITVSNFKLGKGCPHCANSSNSKAMKFFKEELCKNGVFFEEEAKMVKNPKTGAFLRFDFWFPGIDTVVEIDGTQHFKAVACFGGEKAFKDTQYRDSVKNEFCKNNGIDLIRVPLVHAKSLRAVSHEQIKKRLIRLAKDLAKKEKEYAVAVA